MKVVYTGLESSGKSLQLAKIVRELIIRNAKWYKITGIPRPIRTSMPISKEYVEWAESKGIPIIQWRDLDEVIYEEECDVIMDEVLKYFDSRMWASLTLDAKHWLTQGAKTGVHVYASAQDFSQVEKAFRVICNEVYVIKKWFGSRRPMKTAPPVKRIWGVCIKRQVDPLSFNGDNTTMEDLGWPSFFLIDKDDCKIFDTNAKVKPSNLPTLRKRKQEIEYLDEGEVIKRGHQFV